MYSLYLEKNGQHTLVGHYEEEKQMYEYTNAYAISQGVGDHYIRLFNEEKSGQLMTCLDFGSWSEFFYIYPVLEWMKPI